MIIQLSSGQGPAECELAVGKLFRELQKEYPDITVLSSRETSNKGSFSSILFSTDYDLSPLEGSIL